MMCRGEGMQASLCGIGGGERDGTRYSAFEAARERVVAESETIWAYTSSSSGRGKIGPPRAFTALDIEDIISLALAEVNFSGARVGLTPKSAWSKKAWNPSGIVFGERGGVSGRSPPRETGLLSGNSTSSGSGLSLTAKGKDAELLSCSSGCHKGLVVSGLT